MKIVCECGNESEFDTINEDTNEPNEITESEGQYVTLKPNTFRFWEAHDQVGFVCEKCEKALWLFT